MWFCVPAQHRENLTKTVQRFPLDKEGRVVGDVVRDHPDPKYEDLVEESKHAPAKEPDPRYKPPVADDLTTATFEVATAKYPILMVRYL